MCAPVPARSFFCCTTGPIVHVHGRNTPTALATQPARCASWTILQSEGQLQRSHSDLVRDRDRV